MILGHAAFIGVTSPLPPRRQRLADGFKAVLGRGLAATGSLQASVLLSDDGGRWSAALFKDAW